jgi:hypothetical protein
MGHGCGGYAWREKCLVRSRQILLSRFTLYEKAIREIPRDPEVVEIFKKLVGAMEYRIEQVRKRQGLEPKAARREARRVSAHGFFRAAIPTSFAYHQSPCGVDHFTGIPRIDS